MTWSDDTWQILSRWSLQRYCTLLIASRSWDDGVAKRQISPMSTRLIWSRGLSSTGFRNNLCNNLLLQVFRIEPSSCIIPEPAATSIKVTNPDFSIWATFMTAPDGVAIWSVSFKFLIKFFLLFLWIVVDRGLDFENTNCMNVSTWDSPSWCAVLRSVTSTWEATRPDCSDLSVGLDSSNGSALKSTKHACRS